MKKPLPFFAPIPVGVFMHSEILKSGNGKHTVIAQAPLLLLEGEWSEFTKSQRFLCFFVFVLRAKYKTFITFKFCLTSGDCKSWWTNWTTFHQLSLCQCPLFQAAISEVLSNLTLVTYAYVQPTVGFYNQRRAALVSSTESFALHCHRSRCIISFLPIAKSSLVPRFSTVLSDLLASNGEGERKVTDVQ